MLNESIPRLAYRLCIDPSYIAFWILLFPELHDTVEDFQKEIRPIWMTHSAEGKQGISPRSIVCLHFIGSYTVV